MSAAYVISRSEFCKKIFVVVIWRILANSYEKSFIDFKFGQGAALSNILIAISFVFAIFYLRGTRRAIDE